MLLIWSCDYYFMCNFVEKSFQQLVFVWLGYWVLEGCGLILDCFCFVLLWNKPTKCSLHCRHTDFFPYLSNSEYLKVLVEVLLMIINQYPQHTFLWTNMKIMCFFKHRHTIVAGYYGFTLDICVSVHSSIHPSVSHTSDRPSIFRFWMISWVNINGFSRNLVCASILWRSGLGLLMGKFRKILTDLSAEDTPIFSFPDNNLRKWQGILIKLGMCIDIRQIWFLDC